MSRGMVSFLAGLGGGYIKAKDKEYERERQAKIDEREQYKFDQMVKEDGMQAQLRNDLINASRPVTMQEGGEGFILPDTMDNRDVGAAENAALPNGGLMQGMFKVGGKAFADRPAADKALADANSPEAESLRVQEVYRRNGLRDKYMQEFNANEAYKDTIKKRMDTMKREGVTEALSHLRAGSPEQAMKAFQGSGEIKLPEGAKFVQLDGTDMHTGKPGKVWGVQGPDGQTIVADVGQMAAKYLGIEGMFKFDSEAAKTRQTQENWQKNYDLQKLETENNMQYRNRMLRLQESQEARQRETHRAAMEDTKIPPAVKQSASAVSDQLKSVDNALNKAMAEGQFDPNNEGTKRLIEQRAALSIQYRNLLNPYMPGASTSKAADPLGLKNSAPGAAALNVAPSQEQQVAPTNTTTATNQARVIAPAKKADTQPKGREEFVQMQEAMKKGYQPAGRGGAIFGAGEILYVNPQTGERKFASQLFGK